MIFFSFFFLLIGCETITMYITSKQLPGYKLYPVQGLYPSWKIAQQNSRISRTYTNPAQKKSGHKHTRKKNMANTNVAK